MAKSKYTFAEVESALDKATNGYSKEDIDAIIDSISSITSSRAYSLANSFITNSSEFYKDYWSVVYIDARNKRDEYIDTDGRTTYYFSANGNDSNDGLTENTPKKNFTSYVTQANVNVLLKCGDTFNVSSTLSISSNSMLSFYGGGAQPIISFYKPLNVTWNTTDNDNVYQADLSTTDVYLANTTNAYNCNIGQIRYKNKPNWNRKCVFDDADFDEANWLSENAEDMSWSIDWATSIMYLYSTENPNNKEIDYASSCHGFTIASKTDVQIIGVEITGCARHGVSIQSCTNVDVAYNYIHNIGGCVLNLRWARYGNGVEVWSSGHNITITNNFIEWCFDTALTNQGTDNGQEQKHLLFKHNICRNAFWLLESWGDGYSDEGVFEDIVYDSNLIANAMDVTKPNQIVYCSNYSSDIGEDGNSMSYPPYVSYRAGGYFYNQMTLVSAGAGYLGNTTFKNNVGIGTNRFLVLTSGSEETSNTAFENNYFATVCKTSNSGVRFLRYDTGTKTYPSAIPTATDTVEVIVSSDLSNKAFVEKAENAMVKIV